MIFEPDKPLIVAHRGSSANAPENTIAAFETALDEGAEGVEFDVRRSSDGVPVVFHDADLERISGRNEAVADLSSETLCAANAGSWFNRKYPERAKPDFEKQTIPTLDAVLELLRDFAGPVYVELKCTKQDMILLGSAVGKVLNPHSGNLNLIVKSFIHESVPAVLEECPGVETAALFSEHIKLLINDDERLMDLTRSMNADRLSVQKTLINEEFMNAATEAGFPVTVWTANGTKWIEKSEEFGIDSLITNEPAKLLAARTASKKRPG